MCRRRSVPPISSLPLAVLLSACASPGLPPGEGRGLLAWDREPPAGAIPVQRPTWRLGDSFVYLRGGVVRITMRCIAADDDGYQLLEEGSGLVQDLDRDFADRGELAAEPGGSQETRVQLAPRDQRYHWPLWVGKRWTAHLLRKQPGRPALPLAISYQVEAEELITVPAGSFETLRIVRRATVADSGTYLERCSLSWYSPELGVEVRRLEDSTLTELVDQHRQGG